MKNIQSQLFQRVGWTKEFEDTLELFMQMIEIDKRILATVKKENQKKGLFSPAIRFLITDYVNNNKKYFINLKNTKIDKNKIKENDYD